ncbi:MAG: hypothetical protein IPP71_12725 [Bacteroidetes bacterium]|nr:hypothetical protein [Bacteroidota bacterium]
MEKYGKNHGSSKFSLAILESERLRKLGNELMYKRRFNEAILVFQLSIEKNPISPETYDSLGKAYKKIGNNDLALKYSRKSKEVTDNPGSFSR